MNNNMPTGQPVYNQVPPPQGAPVAGVPQPAPPTGQPVQVASVAQAVQAPPQPNIVVTDTGGQTGQQKCPKCGATDISQKPGTDMLRCNFCRHEFKASAVDELQGDIFALQGETRGSGATDLAESTDDVLTLKCTSCGAEVVVNTAESTSARCHWCRNFLSVNNQLPNGAVPDAILPFSLSKEEARNHIEQFVGKRQFFAHPKFKKEFTTENITGVYFPYYLADANAHATFKGEAEHLVREYTVKVGDDEETRYDADAYHVERDFDIAIDDLTIEASADKLDVADDTKTTNIINSILPFDTENCVHYDSNYMRGFTSEKRDTNIENVKNLVRTQAGDIARHKVKETMEFYDRGACWNEESMDVKGSRWSTAYLPVWLYSYYQQRDGKPGRLHYVAVNGRTKETMGSVPIHMPKLISVSAIIEIIAAIIMIPLLIADFASDESSGWPLVLLAAGLVFFAFMYARYRNQDARHMHESETKCEVRNMQKVDEFMKHRKGLSNRKIHGCNSDKIAGGLSNRAKLLKKGQAPVEGELQSGLS